MRIKKIQLQDYKRFHNLTIDLGSEPKRIVVLVGSNGCGKSSIIDAMLFSANSFSTLGQNRTRDYKYHSLRQDSSFDYRKVNVELTNGVFEAVYRQKRTTGKQNTIFSFRSPYRYNSDLNITETKAVNEIRLNSYGATTSNDLDNKMTENYRRLNVKYNNYMRATDSRPSEARAKIIGDLNSSIKNCLDLEVIDIGDVESGRGTLFFRKTDTPTEFNFNLLSSGEKEVVDILLDLYLRQEEYNDTVFLIDEPELHINTSIQKKLLIEINKLVGEDCQIWVATHSIGFLRAIQENFHDDSQVIYFEDGTNWAASPQVLHPMKKTFNQWKKIFETALDDLSGLISPQRIVYCEGRDTPGLNNDERGFDAKVLNTIFGEKHSDTLFISSGGNTELDQRSGIAIRILGKVFSRLEILVLKDRDVSSGRINTENDRQIYLQNNPHNHRIFKRWEIENYLYDKEVLKEYCLRNQLTFDEVEYDRFVSNIVDDNVKDQTGRIKNCCNITVSINPEDFKLKLAECIKEDMSVYNELERCIFNRE
jgi:predicted ATP-dependent endonuclease of OLD family